MAGYMGHIPQPPHSAGSSYSGLRTRLDPSQIPSPVEVMEYDQQQWVGRAYSTLPGTQPPLAGTEYLAIDQGSSTPKFIRATTYAIPSSSRLASQCNIPLAAVFHPFADVDTGDEGVPVVPLDSNPTSTLTTSSDSSYQLNSSPSRSSEYTPNVNPNSYLGAGAERSGPARCDKCRGYINAWAPWSNGGSVWQCKLCGCENQVDPSYFAPLDANLMRTDYLERPELSKGTVDFVVPEEYWALDPPVGIELPYVPSPSPTTPIATATSLTASTPRTPTHTRTTSLLPLTLTQTPTGGRTGRAPRPIDVLFVFDVSQEAVSGGLLEAACESVRGVLYPSDEGGSESRSGSEGGRGNERGKGGDGDGDGCWLRREGGAGTGAGARRGRGRVGILTFDSTVHFWDLSVTPARMLVLADLEESFVPLPLPIDDDDGDGGGGGSGLFMDVEQGRSAIEDLLTTLPERFAQTWCTMSALGSVLRCALAALAGRGGQINLFQSTLPRIGPGALHSQPNEAELYDTDKEKTLFAPRDPSWYDIGDYCASEGVGVNVWLGNGGYVDIGSIGIVASLTGGDIFFHPRFERERDTRVIESEVRRVLTRTTGYNCMVRVRCSKGLQVSEYHGNFSRRSPTDIEFGMLDADKAFTAVFEHTGSLNPRELAFIQCAVLYTTVWGERRVRVSNLALQVVDLAGNVFQYADLDATVYGLTLRALSQVRKKKLSTIREDLTDGCSSILLGYRNMCSSSTQTTQLVLPEVYKTLPLWTLAALKSKPIKARTVSSDVRNYYAHRMLSMSVRTLLRHLYPRFLAIHDLAEGTAVPNERGELVLPMLMRNSYTQMMAHGVYLMDNEEFVIFWIGAAVSPQLLLDLFGVDDIYKIDIQMASLPRLPTRLSTQVHNILDHRQKQRGGRLLPMRIARQNMDAAEIDFSDMLVEDQNNGTMSYPDYLTVVHRQISHILTEGGALGGTIIRSTW